MQALFISEQEREVLEEELRLLEEAGFEFTDADVIETHLGVYNVMGGDSESAIPVV